ncbi:uncharacterized protein LOC123509283 [Portunus trituberculatus]|uniref:uncharacterized protein LOC123509283 n=1 Tax=Portunus trituberculatus TaxID=210409 RepID=UPI001E1D0F66|nr:uncharacterized protein LOC123509283 [Portunus trituberculatus]
MAAQVTLNDLLAAHGGINDVIRQFHPQLTGGEEEEEEEGRGVKNEEVEDKVAGFLEALTALQGAREDLTLVVENANTAALTQASVALTDPQIVGRRVAWCVEAEQHMRSIVENKDLLIYHLQQPLITTFLTMHHQHHRSLVSLLGSLCALMTSLESHTDLLHRHANHSPLITTNNMITSLTKVVATQRDLLRDIKALQTLVTSVLLEEVA